jgi:hypothetical protein
LFIQTLLRRNNRITFLFPLIFLISQPVKELKSHLLVGFLIEIKSVKINVILDVKKIRQTKKTSEI